VRDGLWLADADAGRWSITVTGAARSAAISDFFSLLTLHKGHGFFPEDVNLIRPHLKNFGGAGSGTFAAAIAPIRVDDDIPIARSILKTIIGYHNLAP